MRILLNLRGGLFARSLNCNIELNIIKLVCIVIKNKLISIIDIEIKIGQCGKNQKKWLKLFL